jgi:hypothetical protein
MTETSDNNADSMATALTVGIDYTFPWGNGVAITAENLFGHQAKTEKTGFTLPNIALPCCSAIRLACWILSLYWKYIVLYLIRIICP